MKNKSSRLRILLLSVTTSIAFYPVLLAIVGAIFGLVSLRLEKSGISSNLLENFPYLVINDPDTARTILSTFIGGLTSLTVFSFTMVMILLNQAAARFSPRLLPGLISDKTHQIVLGTYIATILYCIIIIRNIQPSLDYYSQPGLSIMIAILLNILCLGLFAYFIHNISLKIRVEHILDNIYEKAARAMNALSELQKNSTQANFNIDGESICTSPHYGYFQKVEISELQKCLQSNDEVLIEIIPTRGTFLKPGDVLLRTNASSATFKSMTQAIPQWAILTDRPYDDENFTQGFRQVSEIIVKAMSPGINDPGTAIDALDILSKLMALRLALKDKWVEELEGKHSFIQLKIKPFDELVYEIIAPMRQYCKHDVIVIRKIIEIIHFLSNLEQCDSDRNTVLLQTHGRLLQAAKKAIAIPYDIQQLEIQDT